MRKLLLAMLLACITAQVSWADAEQDKIRAIESASKSVVSIRTYRQGQDEPGIGSGVILRSDGYIITNHHVINKAKVVKVTLPGGKTYTAKVWKAAPEKDLALLKIEANNLPVARVGNSAKIKKGETSIAIGDPLGFAGTVTVGTVGSLGRNVKVAGIEYRNLIQTDAAINPGSSGGALVNLKGEVIGINTLVYTGPQSYKHAQGLGFAIPINDAVQLAKKLVQSSSASAIGGKPWLGITGDNLSEDAQLMYGIPAKKGVLVTSVINGSPAGTAGLLVGDTIVAADGQTMLTVSQFLGYLNGKKSGDVIQLSYWRGNKKSTVSVTLDSQSQ